MLYHLVLCMVCVLIQMRGKEEEEELAKPTTPQQIKDFLLKYNVNNLFRLLFFKILLILLIENKNK